MKNIILPIYCSLCFFCSCYQPNSSSEDKFIEETSEIPIETTESLDASTENNANESTSDKSE